MRVMLPFNRFCCVCFAAGVYRKYVVEELFQADRHVHVSFRQIGRAVFLATNGDQCPVWRSCHTYVSCCALFTLLLPYNLQKRTRLFNDVGHFGMLLPQIESLSYT